MGVKTVTQRERRTEALVRAYEQAQAKPFWEIRAASKPKVGELLIYGPIFGRQFWGDEVTPKNIRDELKSLGDIDTLNVYINSPGGDGSAGMAIHNILKRHPARVVVTVDGLAASAAANIVMAGDEIVMPRNAELMIHKAWTVMMGNEKDFLETASALAKFDQLQAVTFSARTGLDEDEVAGMLAAETWMTAEEAVEKGFADRIEEDIQIAASVDAGFLTFNGLRVDSSMFRAVPSRWGVQIPPETPPTPPSPPNTPDPGQRQTPLSLFVARTRLRRNERRMSR